jgi:5-methylcytosine-specific restriction endonuclease McrA
MKSNRQRLSAWKQILLQDPCVYCGEPAEVLDHIVPRIDGGTRHDDNMAPACSSCNNWKGPKSLLAFLGARRWRETWDEALEQRARWNAVGR